MFSIVLAVAVLGAEPKSPPKTVAISDVASQIDESISGIDRGNLTQAKADQKLRSALAAFAAKRQLVSVEFIVEDINAEWRIEYFKLDVVSLDTSIAPPEFFVLPKRYRNILDADKGDVVTFTGTVCAAYSAAGHANVPQNGLYIGTSGQADLFLVNWKVSVSKPMAEVEK